jgi:hypothetical protein
MCLCLSTPFLTRQKSASYTSIRRYPFSPHTVFSLLLFNEESHLLCILGVLLGLQTNQNALHLISIGIWRIGGSALTSCVYR